MKKVITLLTVICILVASSASCFAQKDISAVGTSGENGEAFKEVMEDLFGDPEIATVTDVEGNDITKDFVEQFNDEFMAGEFETIWNFTKYNISSILISEEVPTIQNSIFALQNADGIMASKTFNVKDFSVFTEYGVNSGGVSTNLEFAVVVRGRYTENMTTGKILSASVTSVKMEYTNPGVNWKIYSVEETSDAIINNHNILFVGALHFVARYLTGDPYISDTYSHQFRVYAE